MLPPLYGQVWPAGGGQQGGRPAGGGTGKDRAGGGEGGPARAGGGCEGRCFILFIFFVFFWVLPRFLGGGWSGVAMGYLHSLN